MRANRGRDTKPELALRSALHKAGLRFRKNLRIDLDTDRARPDVVFPRAKVAVFVDGCFWHGCSEHRSLPQGNATFWERKINGTRARDKQQTRLLEEAGWIVVRVWEHEPPGTAVQRVETALRLARRRRHTSGRESTDE
jgi:DNA mismatch endonuclease, patch repair protein